jgi:hypothetical protein
MQKPTPVTHIAIRSDVRVSRGSYVVGSDDLKASIATKCVAQMPDPVATAVWSIHAQRLRPLDRDDIA